MARLFDEEGLQITDDWIRSRTGSYAIGAVREAWVTRRQVTRGSRLLTAGLGAGVDLVFIGGAGMTGWLSRNWIWLLFSPVFFFIGASIGLFDPIAIYLEKRHHELWISTASGSARIYKANAVESNKALRAIHRACERHRESL